MPLTRDQASETLRDIQTAERRSSSAYGYQLAAPHLILWGVIWVVGYGSTYLKPQWAMYWPILVIAGFAGSTYIGRCVKPAGKAAFDWRYLATFVAIFAFITALFAIMPPANGLQAAAFSPLFVGLIYAGIGIWMRALRMLILGIALGALTLVGFFFLKPYFLVWLAVVGGGALILGGFWLRRV